MKHITSYILESLGELYHFTNIGNLINIIQGDKLYGFDGGDGYAISTTRMRNTVAGYPNTMINKNMVRIILNPSKINQKYKIKPFVWDDTYRYPEKANKINGSYNDWNSLYEAEERIMLGKDEYIKDLHKYISRIDICSTTFSTMDDWEDSFDILNEYCEKYNIKLKLYDSIRKFGIGK